MNTYSYVTILPGEAYRLDRYTLSVFQAVGPTIYKTDMLI